MLCSQVQDNGMTDTVCTLFELRAGDDTVNEGKLMNKQLVMDIGLNLDIL